MFLDEAITRIEEDLSSNPTLLAACLAIVRTIASQDPQQFRRITYGMVARIAEVKQASDAMPAVAYLCGDRVPVFIPRHSFIDDEHDEPIDDDVMRSLLAGSPYYDAHGDKVESPLDRVFTHFELSPMAKTMGRRA